MWWYVVKLKLFYRSLLQSCYHEQCVHTFVCACTLEDLEWTNIWFNIFSVRKQRVITIYTFLDPYIRNDSKCSMTNTFLFPTEYHIFLLLSALKSASYQNKSSCNWYCLFNKRFIFTLSIIAAREDGRENALQLTSIFMFYSIYIFPFRYIKKKYLKRCA